MLKNKRPYSIEHGYIDEALITNRDDEVIRVVSEWIRKNIRKAKKILKWHTSYGLKHMLEYDTGIYLTNNEFKDAMLLLGHKPADPDELNWRYRILLTKYINDNPSPFFNWAKQFKKEISPRGDFVRDMLSDFEFPTFAERNIISLYLGHIGACAGAFDAFEELWNEYGKTN